MNYINDRFLVSEFLFADLDRCSSVSDSIVEEDDRGTLEDEDDLRSGEKTPTPTGSHAGEIIQLQKFLPFGGDSSGLMYSMPTFPFSPEKVSHDHFTK